jgi:hypothetical protein
MRTTITLEGDVVAALARLEKEEGMSAREAINLAVRAFVAGRTRQVEYTTPTADLGSCLVGSLDDVGESLAFAERDDFR